MPQDRCNSSATGFYTPLSNPGVKSGTANIENTDQIEEKRCRLTVCDCYLAADSWRHKGAEDAGAEEAGSVTRLWEPVGMTAGTSFDVSLVLPWRLIARTT